MRLNSLSLTIDAGSCGCGTDFPEAATSPTRLTWAVMAQKEGATMTKKQKWRIVGVVVFLAIVLLVLFFLNSPPAESKGAIPKGRAADIFTNSRRRQDDPT
jgi:disulfide bond formation protein DsbB